MSIKTANSLFFVKNKAFMNDNCHMDCQPFITFHSFYSLVRQVNFINKTIKSAAIRLKISLKNILLSGGKSSWQ